jgi:hypothetical protein
MLRRSFCVLAIITFWLGSAVSTAAWENQSLEFPQVSRQLPTTELKEGFDLEAPKAEIDTERSEFLELTDSEYKRLRQLLTAKTVPMPTPESEELTPREFKRLKQLLSTEKATAWEVGLVNLAIKWPNLIMALFVGLVFLVVLRTVFGRWFSPIVYTEAWPSVAVILGMLGFMAVVLYAALS